MRYLFSGRARLRPRVTAVLVLLALLNTVDSFWASQIQDELRMIVLQGNGGTNNTQAPSAVSFVVQVQDNNGPRAGARVTFKAPDTGASGRFPSGSAVTVSTDQSGIAEARGFLPNSVAGPFDVVVTVENSQTMATIAQTNQAPKGQSMKWLVVILGAVGGGAALALGRGGSSSPTPSSTPTQPTIQPGTPTVQPPS